MTPDVAIAAIAANQHGVFTRTQATKVGFTRDSIRRRLQSGLWVGLHRGVYGLASAHASWERDVYAAVVAYGRTALASGETAASVLGLIDHRGTPVHVTLPAGQRRNPRRGVVVHQAALKRSDARAIDGIRMTGPNRTLVDISGTLTTPQLEGALDTALFRGLVSVQSLHRYIADRGLDHRPGVGTLRRMIADRQDGTSQSELERIFFRKLRKSGLPEPTRQLPVGSRFIDISYPANGVIIELDGHGSRFTAAALRDDRRRQNEIVLALPGWTLLRFTWDDVVNKWPAVEETLRSVLNA